MTPAQIITFVSSYFDIPEDHIKGKSRQKEIVHARHICVYLIYMFCNVTYQQIQSDLDYACHGTIITGCKSVKNQMETNRQYRLDVYAIIKGLIDEEMIKMN